jgi:hypothetical protein
MKSKLIAHYIILFIILGIASSCGFKNNYIKTPLQKNTTIPPINTATKTPLQVSKISPTTTHFPTPTFTQAYIPTLNENDAKIKLLSLLAGNGNCKLPCLWGITPGISTFFEAQNMLYPLNIISEFTSFHYSSKYSSWIGNMILNYYDDDLQIFVTVDVVSDPGKDIIGNIAFFANAYMKNKISGIITYPDSWIKNISFYSVSHIMTEIGRPSSVLLSTRDIPSSAREVGLIEMIMLFPDDGIVAYYTLKKSFSGNNFIGCLSNNSAQLDLYPSGNGSTFMDRISMAWKYQLKSFKPIEDVTTMSIDEFYQTFRNPTAKCLVTPANVWPTPG